MRLALILLTNRIGVFPAEGAASLQLIDKGMKRVSLTSLNMGIFPIEMTTTFLLSRLLTRIHPLKVMYVCYLLRISMSLLLSLFIHSLPAAELEMMPSRFYPLAYTLVILSSLAGRSMNVAGVRLSILASLLDGVLRSDF